MTPDPTLMLQIAPGLALTEGGGFRVGLTVLPLTLNALNALLNGVGGIQGRGVLHLN